MAHRQFTIFAPAAYRPEADALAARIRAANPSQVPLVRTVGSFPQLQTELHKQNTCDWLFLFADWVGGKLAYGGEQRSLAELATEWKGTVRLWDREVLRLEGNVTGRRPTATARFLRLVGRGTAELQTAWTSPTPFP
jgi:hypothetical protein